MQYIVEGAPKGPVWLPGSMFLLAGSLSPVLPSFQGVSVQGVSVQGLCSRGGGGKSEKRAVRILLKCFLVY